MTAAALATCHREGEERDGEAGDQEDDRRERNSHARRADASHDDEPVGSVAAISSSSRAAWNLGVAGLVAAALPARPLVSH